MSDHSNQDRVEQGRILHEIAGKVIKGDLPADGLAEQRIKVCENCPSFRKLLRNCSVCNCFMDFKTKIVNTVCPLEYW